MYPIHPFQMATTPSTVTMLVMPIIHHRTCMNFLLSAIILYILKTPLLFISNALQIYRFLLNYSKEMKNNA